MSAGRESRARIPRVASLALALALAPGLGACASEPEDGLGIPDGWRLIYSQGFDGPRAEEDFAASDPSAWRVVRGDEGYLELHAASASAPPQRSPASIALLVGPWLGDFILEVELMQTGRDYDHRDLCLFFGFHDAEHYYYAHLASKADDAAHQVFRVEGGDRRPVTTTRSFGVDWGRDVWHHARLERDLESGRVRLFLDRAPDPVLEARDQRLGEGWVGLGSFDDTGRFARLKLYAREYELRSPRFFAPLAAASD